MKTSKRIISFVLCALMVASCFFCTGKLPELEAKAATVGDFSQTRVVSNYESLYRTYQKRFFGGEETNWPTNFVIPGLSEGQDYTPQGMTYWKAKEWILISAYDATTVTQNDGESDADFKQRKYDTLDCSVIYALDVVTTNLVAVFKIQNADGTKNQSHGGGIAASEYNFYYADSGSKVSYIPLSEMDVTSGVHTIKLKDSVDFSTELTGSAVGNTTPVKTSYCCYDDGVLWTGNFYYAKDSSYSQDFMNSVGYPSVLMGYKLVGNSSDEEWNHLKTGSGAPSTAEHKGCAGDPTYVIGLNFDKIQYAMVDKGKVYVSRSWKRTWSDNHTRDLVIGEIDLNVPGTTQAQIAGSNRYVHLVNYEDCIHFGGDNGGSSEQLNKMFYMGEALCVIDDYLYMFGEGAAWNYNGKDSSNVCPEPIDVIWKIDQYAIQGLTRPHEDVAAVEYEKVYSLSELNSTDEYIVLHESPIKDSVTQDNILYLLDSFGGYGDKRLPKKATTGAGDINDASTGDSRGIVGYEIRDYSVKVDEETGKESLILNAEDDANKSLQWKFESGSSSELVLSNRELYYAKHPYLYSGDTFFAMTTAADPNIQIECDNNGNFKIKGNKNKENTDSAGNTLYGYYIWCNDGSDASKITAYTDFYSNHGKTGYIPNYNGLTEQAGTFHAQNASHPANGSAEQQIFHIYKRVSDPYASSYETQVYTDLSAKLTSDGTYDITLETYATDSIQYQRTNKKRPTDFIFVLDLSGSMDETDARGYKTDSSWSPLTMSQACGDVSNSFFSRGSNYNTAHSGNFWFKFPDGEYGQIHVAFNEKDSSSAYARDIWLWAEHPDTKRCYRLSKFGFMTKGNYAGGADWTQDSAARITDADFLENHLTLGWANEAAVMTDVNADRYRTDYHGTGYNSTGERAGYEVMNYTCNQDGVVVTASYYTYTTCMRTDAVKNAVDSLTYKIAAEATEELDHRIAIVSSASDGRGPGYIWTNTGIYTNDSTSLTQYTGEGTIPESTYKKAFFTVDEFGEVRSIVSNLKQDGFTYINNGLELAGNIVEASDADYDINGSRSAVVIVISDGAAGGDTSDTISLASSTESANGALSAAYDLKRQGAYIFSVRVGDVTSDDDYYVSGFDYDGFMKYLSSKYMGSKSMTDIGPVNPKEYQYYTHVPADDNFSLEYITDTVFNAVTANSVNAISSLTAEAILREHLTDAFDTSNASIKYETAQSKYDGIGRLYFEDPVTASGFTTTFDKANNNIEVKGFDYSANNVSEYNSNLGNGKKLIVTISGVIADADKELLNTSINDTSLTALYENSTYMSSNQPVKKFPTYHFSIPEYTYVMDYGLPMLDTDINGTLCSVDTAPDKQDTYATVLNTDVLKVEFAPDENGVANQNMYYSLNSQEGSTEKNSRAYVLIKRDNGDYDWFRLNLIPASVIYYEENKTATLAGSDGYADWTQVGSTAGKYQSLSASNDVFGNDPILSNSTDNFSLGTHLETTVSSSNKRSDTKTFSFRGTGFDLISACGSNTGIQTVTVRNADGELVQVYMVDTYYNDAKYGTIYQAPIVHFEGDYGEYTVETTAAYYSFAGGLTHGQVVTSSVDGTNIDAYTATAETSVTDELFAQIGMDELIGQEVELIWMDENSVLNGGIGATEATVSTQGGTASTTPVTSLVNYIDGFRIYNPLEEADANAYYPATEKDARFFNLVEHLGTGALQGDDDFIGYIEGSSTNFAFADYVNNGPKNEIYLDNGGALTFKLKVNMKDLNNVRPFLSMRAVSGNPIVVINGLEYANIPKNETYYDVLAPLFQDGGVVEAPAEGSTTGTYQYTISLKSSSTTDLVAIGNLRLTNAELVNLNAKDLSTASVLLTMASSPVDYDTSKLYSPAPTFAPAPADDPNIDPEGRIPTLEEYIAIHGSGNNGDDHSGADSFADKIIAIVEKLIDIIKKVIALVANTVTKIF